jgi:hypothetical protein
VTSTGARRSGFAASMPPKTRADDDNLRLSIRHALVLARCLSSHNIQDRATIERLKTSQVRFSRRFRCRERGSLGGVEHPPAVRRGGSMVRMIPALRDAIAIATLRSFFKKVTLSGQLADPMWGVQLN